MSGDIQSALLGALVGLGASTVFVLVLLVGFCVVFGLPKLRMNGKNARVVRSLDEMMGGRTVFLSPDAPHGPTDQLKTPELIEAARSSS